MSTWLVPREELTPEQLRAIELDTRENRVILGGPGSGKTQILLHRGQFLRDRLKVPPERIHIFVYTAALRAYIQSALALLDLPDDMVTTLDAWCMNFHNKHIGGRRPWNSEEKRPDFAAIRKAVLGHLKTTGKKPFDVVLVDEAQDLDAEAFQLLAAVANHITVCRADHKQQIYDHGSEISSILKWLGVRRGNVTLLETYRCCPYIVQLASKLIDDSVEREAYIRQARTSQTDAKTPLLHYASSADNEMLYLIDAVRTRLSKGERIAILFPQQRQAYGYSEGFKKVGIDVENPKELDFTTDKPKLMPYHSAKGLTFDTIMLPRLVPSAFGKLQAERIPRVLFVGITRATKWLYLSTVGDRGVESVEHIRSAAASEILTVRKAGQSPCPPSAAPTTEQEDDFLDLL